MHHPRGLPHSFTIVMRIMVGPVDFARPPRAHTIIASATTHTSSCDSQNALTHIRDGTMHQHVYDISTPVMLLLM